jgi:hypothetical protein
MLTQAAALRYNRGVGHMHMASRIPVPRSSQSVYEGQHKKRARNCARSQLSSVKYTRAKNKFKGSDTAKPKNYESSSVASRLISAPVFEGQFL